MARDKLVQLRVSADELARYKGAAGKRGLSAWLRCLVERELMGTFNVDDLYEEPEPLTIPASAKRALDAKRACLEASDEAVAGGADEAPGEGAGEHEDIIGESGSTPTPRS